MAWSITRRDRILSTAPRRLICQSISVTDEVGQLVESSVT